MTQYIEKLPPSEVLAEQEYDAPCPCGEEQSKWTAKLLYGVVNYGGRRGTNQAYTETYVKCTREEAVT